MQHNIEIEQAVWMKTVGRPVRAVVKSTNNREIYLQFDDGAYHHPGKPFRILYWSAFTEARAS